ncbi:uncharacterized protein TNCV_4143751 [Trichonephila clavipes]|nr:uncharacterized protein TNCV_4143751 [Trichonephila clavipes]
MLARIIFNAPFDVNMRIVQGILSLGLGYSALEKICMHMNVSIMSGKTFNYYKAKVLNGHLVGSNQLFLDVRKNVREAYGLKNDKDIVDIGVSYDGSWLTRGHTVTPKIESTLNSKFTITRCRN